MNVLVTGGSGTLGTALRKLRPEWVYPFSWQFNMLNPLVLPEPRPDVILHAAAYTSVSSAENGGAGMAWLMNVSGTANVAKLGVPMVYISTEYVFDGAAGNYDENAPQNPVNWYGKTKSEGEIAAMSAPRALVIRTLFKPEPFPHPRACVDQWTSGDTVSEIAPLVVKCVEAFADGAFGQYDSIHVGTGHKSTYEIAVKTRPEVEKCLRSDIPTPLPRDTSLNCAKFFSMFGEI